MRSIKQLLNLSGRKALVTGGAGHIGLAIEEALLELGARVAILDADAGKCDERARQLARFGKDSVVSAPCDLLDEKETRDVMAETIKKMGGLDILVHGAAYVGTTKVSGWTTVFEKQTVEAWDKALRVNLTSAFVLTQAAAPALKKSGGGSVIFVASTYGVAGPDMSLYKGTTMANPVGYGASKGGLIQMMRYLSTLLAPRVRVNCVSPGGVWRQQPEAFHKRYKLRTPLKRMATEEDFKGAVAYLASDLSAYVTGHNLMVDGGWTAW